MKLNYKRTVLIGFAFMSILAFWQFYDQVIPYLLENVFGLSTFVTNNFMALDNVLAVFMLPLFGMLSDKTRTPLGKRTPFILFGTLASVSLLLLLGYFESIRSFTGFFVTLGGLLIAMAVYRSPAVAYMPDVTEKPLRSKANAVINLVGYIGGIFSTVVMMFMLKSDKTAEGGSVYSADQSFFPVFAVVAAFMLISVLIMTFSLKENKILAETNVVDEEEETSTERLSGPVKKSLVLILISVLLWYMAYNAVTTAFSRYCINVLNVDLGASSGYLTVATISAIIAFVPLGFLSERVGRKKAVLLGIVLMAACFGIAAFLRAPTPLMYLLFALVGVGWASINVNSYPMVVEMSKGKDVGRYTGYYYTFSMAAQITTPLLSGLLIDKTPWGYYILFPYAIVFCVLAFITMSLVRHGDTKPVAKNAILENFAAED